MGTGREVCELGRSCGGAVTFWKIWKVGEAGCSCFRWELSSDCGWALVRLSGPSQRPQLCQAVSLRSSPVFFWPTRMLGVLGFSVPLILTLVGRPRS